MPNTEQEFQTAIATCRNLFAKKLQDYSASWRILRPSSLTDQIFIKAKRIRTLQINGESKVGEGIYPEFIAIVNYGVIGLIQLQLGFADEADIDAVRALELYDYHIQAATSLMLNKNCDYDEAWRSMRLSSITDIILQKIARTKEIEDNNGMTIVSEGIDANYMDMINYSLFAIIKYDEGCVK